MSLHDSLNSTAGLPLPAVPSGAAQQAGLSTTGLITFQLDTFFWTLTIVSHHLLAFSIKFSCRLLSPSAGHSYVQSGASEVEALQEAYRQITDLVEECEEHEQEPSRSPPSPSTPEAWKKTLQNASTAESGDSEWDVIVWLNCRSQNHVQAGHLEYQNWSWTGSFHKQLMAVVHTGWANTEEFLITSWWCKSGCVSS